MDSTSRATVSVSQLVVCSVDHELQHANDVGWTAVPTKQNVLKEEPNKWREGKRFFYWLLLQWDWTVVQVGLKCYSWKEHDWISGGWDWLHTRHKEIIWLKVSNENLPCEHLCGGNKSICSQLIILQFGTVSNSTEYYTTVFESDDQVGIWKLEFLTDVQQLTPTFGLCDKKWRQNVRST